MAEVSIGRELRDQNLSRVERGRHIDWLAETRKKAVEIAKTKGCVSINDLRQATTLPPGAHHNTWGAVLRIPELKATGQYEPARHNAAHARNVRIFSLA